jgi:hypothetical protein
MRKLLIMGALSAFPALAADWTGYIIDKSCASQKGMRGDVDCAQSCLRRGDPAVFVTEDGKIYTISNQAKVIPSAGKKVTMTGTIKDDVITVETIKDAS